MPMRHLTQPTQSVIAILQEELFSEIISVYKGISDTCSDQYLVILFESNMAHSEQIRPIYQKLTKLGNFQFIAYAELLNMLSSNPLQVISWSFQMKAILGKNIMADFQVNFDQICALLEGAFQQESLNFRHQYLNASLSTSLESLLCASWQSFKTNHLPALMLISGITINPPPLWENIERAFSLPWENLLLNLSELEEEILLPAQEAWELCLKWEECLRLLALQAEKFARHSIQFELSLNNVAGKA
jgi:hypothetical protein